MAARYDSIFAILPAFTSSRHADFFRLHFAFFTPFRHYATPRQLIEQIPSPIFAFAYTAPRRPAHYRIAIYFRHSRQRRSRRYFHYENTKKRHTARANTPRLIRMLRSIYFSPSPDTDYAVAMLAPCLYSLQRQEGREGRRGHVIAIREAARHAAEGG